MLDYPLAQIFLRICQLNQQKLSKKELKAFYQSHPSPHELDALVQLFLNWGIEFFELQTTFSHLPQLQFPFISQIERRASSPEHVLVESMNESHIYFFSKGKHESMKLEEFQDIWQEAGVLLFSFETGRCPEVFTPGWTEYWDSFSMGIVCLFSYFCLLFLKVEAVSLNLFWGFPLLSLLGLFVVYLIANKEKGKSNERLNRFCRSKHIDTCDLLIHSHYGKIFGSISWTSLGFIFFASNLIFLLLIPQLDAESISCLFLFSLATIPGIIASLSIQGFLSDYWCKLCVLSISMIGLHILFLFFIQDSFIFPSLEHFFYLFLSILLSLISWTAFSSQLTKEQKSLSQVQDLTALKFNPTLIQKLFSPQNPPNSFSHFPALEFGAAASTRILYISNPSCLKCGDAFTVIRDLASEEIPGLRINLLFHLYADEKDKVELVHELTRIYQQDKKLFWEALGDWYEDIHQSVEKWKENLPKQAIAPLSSALPLVPHDSLYSLPALFLNEQLLPSAYSHEDLAILLYKLEK